MNTQDISKGFILVPQKMVDMFCNAADNLGDMPISDKWAEDWSNNASNLLEEYDYFRN